MNVEENNVIIIRNALLTNWDKFSIEAKSGSICVINDLTNDQVKKLANLAKRCNNLKTNHISSRRY